MTAYTYRTANDDVGEIVNIYWNDDADDEITVKDEMAMLKMMILTMMIRVTEMTILMMMMTMFIEMIT